MIETVLGQKFNVGKARVAPNNDAVSAYLKAARDGEGLAKKVLAELKKKNS